MNQENTKNRSVISIIFIILFTTIFVAATVLILVKGTDPSTTNEISSNVKVENDLQTIDIEANPQGYVPMKMNAKASIKSKILLTSNGAYGCEQSLTIPKLGIKKMLPANGVTEVEIPAQPAGTKLLGSCSMGMYTFTISYI